MTLVRLLGFATLECGCLIGRYRDATAGRDVDYVEEKGTTCSHANHTRNQPLGRGSERDAVAVLATARAS